MSSSNGKRLIELELRHLAACQRASEKGAFFFIGARVREPYGKIGRIDVIFADYQAALDSLMIREGWYESQEKPPKTPKDKPFYSVVLENGAVLVGEDDFLELATTAVH